MKKLDEIIAKVLNMTFEQKVYVGKESLNRLIEILYSYGFDDLDNSNLIINLMKYFVSMDMECSEEEYEMVNAIFEIDLTYEEFYALTNGGAEKDFIKMMNKVINKFTEEDRVCMCTFGLVIIASDNYIDDKELKLFKKLCK
ncbi:MAG: hypothetical protein ACI35S_07030 [Anaeroplasma sp.]